MSALWGCRSIRIRAQGRREEVRLFLSGYAGAVYTRLAADLCRRVTGRGRNIYDNNQKQQLRVCAGRGSTARRKQGSSVP